MIGYLYDANDEEIEVLLDGTISKYHPATMYKNNGDPGDPEEGGELEDFSVKLDGIDITDTLSKDEYERLREYFVDTYDYEEDYSND